MQYQKDNNYIFIDSQNVNLAIRDQGWELDFGKFRRYLSDKYHVQKAFLFIGYVAGNEALYTYLQSVGYIEHLEKQKKLGSVFIPNPRKYSALLRKFRRYFVYLDGLQNKLSRKREGASETQIKEERE